MISKSQISFIKSLHHKKFRKEHGLFIAEGIKSINEFASGKYDIQAIYSTGDASSKLDKLSGNVKQYTVSVTELQKISTLITPQQALAIINIPNKTEIEAESLKNRFSLILDGIQDPGNLGTIIRTADWFGIENIICSEDTVDLYNPKVVQATMGSLTRVNVHYQNLQSFLSNSNIPVFGAFLDGQSIYTTSFKKEGLLVLGNEGNGISEEVANYVDSRITIPRFGGAESLNVAISAAILCSELKR